MSDVVMAIRQRRADEQVGTPEEVYHRPATPFAHSFLGEGQHAPVVDGAVAPFGLPAEGRTRGLGRDRPEACSS